MNSVISLSEQERMKSDVEYGAAVNRLRIRECTRDDVKLFNSRVIKSIDKPNGVDMAATDNFEAAAIVKTNRVREPLNVRKAKAICSAPGSPELIVCAALDKIEHRVPESGIRTELLKQDMSSANATGLNALPGFISMYVGMPVILRSRNLSTELGVTNGSQGFLRGMKTAQCSAGYTYCTEAIIEFPTSRVDIPGLPKKHYPISMVNWGFTAQLSNGRKVRVTRSQMPFQPGLCPFSQDSP